MLMACEICKQEFITESDPYVIRPTPKGYIHYCSCMIVGHNQMSGIDKLQAENKKLREALEKIRNIDWGTDHCDAKNMIADKSLEEINEKL